MAKKITVLLRIISAMLAVSLLSSCGLIVINYPKDSAETTAQTETETETEALTEEDPKYKILRRDSSALARKYLKTIDKTDYTGAVVKIASVVPSLTDPDKAPQVISKAVARRNQLVKEKLGVSLVTVSTDATALFAELSASAKSGMYYTDLMLVPQNSVASFAASGLLFNLRSMPNLDLSEEYFNKSSVAALAAGYNAYGVAAHATLTPYTLPAMYFSADRLRGLGLSLPYQTVKDGKWTWDAYNKLTVDVGEWNKLTLGDCGDFCVDAAFASVGGKFVSAGVMTSPTVAVTTEGSTPLLDIIMPAFADEKAITGEWASSQAFRDSAVFMIDTLDRMQTLTPKDGDTMGRWGIVPMPKATEDAEYVTLASPLSTVFAVPSIVASDERTAMVLRTVCAASADRLPIAYREHTQNEMLPDNESALMLEMITDSVVYDFVYTAGSMYPEAQEASNYVVRNTVLYWTDLTYQLDMTVPAAEDVLRTAFPMG